MEREFGFVPSASFCSGRRVDKGVFCMGVCGDK